MWFNRHTTDRNYSGKQKVNFESPVPFSKCLRAKSYSNMNTHFDPQGCQTLLLKESEPFLLSFGSWTICEMGFSFDELAAVLKIRMGNRVTFGIFIHIFL